MKNTLICAKKAVNISTHNVITKSFCRLSAIFRLQNRYIKKGKRVVRRRMLPAQRQDLSTLRALFAQKEARKIKRASGPIVNSRSTMLRFGRKPDLSWNT